MKQHFSAGGVLINNQNQIYLIHKKSRDEWVLPKGGIEEAVEKVSFDNLKEVLKAASRELGILSPIH